MTVEEKIAFINSQVACALITLEGMKAMNREREMRGESLAYGEHAFFDLRNEFIISHNSVLEYLNSL